MKYISVLGLLVLFTCCHSNKQKANEETNVFFYYQDETIQELLNRIVRTDSISTTCHVTFRSFDKNDFLITQLKYYRCQNNSKNEYLTRTVYGQQGKLILEQVFNMEGAELKRKLY